MINYRNASYTIMLDIIVYNHPKFFQSGGHSGITNTEPAIFEISRLDLHGLCKTRYDNLSAVNLSNRCHAKFKKCFDCIFVLGELGMGLLR